MTISYAPGGYGTPNDGVIGDIPAGTALTFGIPQENTNFLQTGTVGAVTGSDGDPFTFNYEFGQSALVESQQLGVPIEGAAVPGANETFATDQNILPYYQSVAPTSTTPGYTGFLTGGWTGVGSGYPSAIGYMSPSALDQGAVYIAPNMTFDFTEIQYEGKTAAQADADWAAQMSSLTANAAGTPVLVLPIHDYGVTGWNTTTDTATGSLFVTQMYTNVIAQAYADNYEFVTLEDLASRIAAEQKASINYTTVGNTITATITPDPTAPDVGEMALNVINGGTDVIQNVTNWYAYNSQELFVPRNGGTFVINLGTTQGNVTHIASLPMRADLLSVTGDGLNLAFSVNGEGDVLIDLGQVGNDVPVVTGASISNLVGNQLTLSLTGLGEHDVTLDMVAPPTEVVSTVALSADTGASATDFITDVAAQTITGTLSAPLVAGDVVEVSVDDGNTWQAATAATGATTFSLAGVTLLTGSNTLLAEVVAGRHSQYAFVAGLRARHHAARRSLNPGSDCGVGQRCVPYGRHHQRHHADLHWHGRGRHYRHPLRRHYRGRHRHCHVGGGLDHHHDVNPGERRPEHHRQGDGYWRATSAPRREPCWSPSTPRRPPLPQPRF